MRNSNVNTHLVNRETPDIFSLRELNNIIIIMALILLLYLRLIKGYFNLNRATRTVGS
jgi:hypothetical protein